jgi:hypothetical protein
MILAATPKSTHTRFPWQTLYGGLRQTDALSLLLYSQAPMQKMACQVIPAGHFL